jgi:hypothetical protein
MEVHMFLLELGLSLFDRCNRLNQRNNGGRSGIGNSRCSPRSRTVVALAPGVFGGEGLDIWIPAGVELSVDETQNTDVGSSGGSFGA